MQKSPNLNRTIAATCKALETDPERSLDPLSRKRIYDSVGFPGKRLAHLALITAHKVLDRWTIDTKMDEFLTEGRRMLHTPIEGDHRIAEDAWE